MLSEQEAKVLADRTAGTIKGMDKKRAKALTQFFDKYAPGVSLVIAVAMIAGPRVKQSQLRNQRGITTGAAPGNDRGEAPEQPTSNATPGSNPQWDRTADAESPGVTAVPLTAADLAEFGGVISSNY